MGGQETKCWPNLVTFGDYPGTRVKGGLQGGMVGLHQGVAWPPLLGLVDGVGLGGCLVHV